MIVNLIQSISIVWKSPKLTNDFSPQLEFHKIIIEVVIGSHTDCILQQLVVILTASNN